MGLFDSLNDRVSVYEVSPRDGLQNEAGLVPTLVGASVHGAPFDAKTSPAMVILAERERQP